VTWKSRAVATTHDVRPLALLLVLALPTLASAQASASRDDAPAETELDGAPAEPDAGGAVERGSALPAPVPGGRTLARPSVLDPERTARLLAGIEARRLALSRDRGSAELEMVVAVNLYVGGALLALLTTSLLVGVAFEGACIHGVIDECTDGAAFLIGAIPAAIGALALFAGAFTTETRARARHRAIDDRERGLEDAAASEGVRLAPAPGGIAARF
jgi:hypothetical protein